MTEVRRDLPGRQKRAWLGDGAVEEGRSVGEAEHRRLWKGERCQRLWQGSRWAKAGIECRTQERLTGVQNLASQQKASPAGD